MTAPPLLGTSPAIRSVPGPRTVKRRIYLCWGLLVLNVIPFYPGEQHLLLPIPGVVGKLITQGSLAVALILAMSINRRGSIRRSTYILLVTVMAGVALMDSLRSDFIFGSLYRVCRLLAFLLTLLLLTPWWGRRDLLLVKVHLTVIGIILGSVLVGYVVAPGVAMGSEGRLGGSLWPIPATQVGRYAATAIGLTAILWMSGTIQRKAALITATIALPMLLLTHTRTALVSMAAGLLIAGLSLFRTRARVRRAFAIGTVIVSIGALSLSSVLTTWIARGQDTQQLSNLTGRTVVWEQVLAQSRGWFELLFGIGLTNKSFNGLAIDSNWISTYYELGLVGVALNIAMLLFLLVAASFRPHGVHRALALYLVGYAIVSSFTETGLGDASLALLELTLAASLLLPTLHRGPR
ncbi:O-antigen ligase family protein [Kribbella sp. C-35]|uniref:O-antigen ligase family protein n=1 Tax=Kribbella sp. C-35 TaxID=2789276 RepID=UPI00397D12AA